MPRPETGEEGGEWTLSTAEEDWDKDHLSKVNIHSLQILMGYFQDCWAGYSLSLLEITVIKKVPQDCRKERRFFFFFKEGVQKIPRIANLSSVSKRLWRKPFWKLCPDTGTASTDLPGTSCPNTTGCFLWLWMRGENYWLLTLTLMSCLTVWNNVFIKKYGFNAWLKKCVRNYPDC